MTAASSGERGYFSVSESAAQLERLVAQRGRGPSLAWDNREPAEHIVQFYEDDGFLLDGVVELIGLSLREGDSGILVATPEHRAALSERMRSADVDLEAAETEGRFAALDAAATLAQIMADDAPSPEAFNAVIGPLVARAGEHGRRVRVFGEMVGLLAAEGKHAEAIRLEELWNELQTRYAFSLFCGYPIAVFDNEALGGALSGVCGTHSRVLPAESYTNLSNLDDQLRGITLLQQKARSLEVEVALREQIEQQLRDALEAERTARAAAEAALNMRDEFLSVASHELKTPVTALSAYAQLALRRISRQGQVDPERVEHALQTITRQAERLTRLLGQLLDVSRLESGKLTLEAQLTDVRALVGQVLAAAEPTSDHHTFALQAPPALEAVVDPLRLEQVLVNLLDNAVKYSPEGGEIELRLSQTSPEQFEVSVRDHGLGIPPDKRGQIFERFYQAHAHANRGGMGLGLYITRQIVELHGGSIRAEFPPDGGTRVVVRLPVGGEAWSSIASSSVSAA